MVMTWCTWGSVTTIQLPAGWHRRSVQDGSATTVICYDVNDGATTVNHLNVVIVIVIVVRKQRSESERLRCIRT